MALENDISVPTSTPSSSRSRISEGRVTRWNLQVETIETSLFPVILGEGLGSDGDRHVCVSLAVGPSGVPFSHRSAGVPAGTSRSSGGEELENAASLPDRAEIIVVGGGPAGLAGATTLHQAGREVLLGEMTALA